MSQAFALPLSDPQAELAVAGGKGASLVRIVRAGLPVPKDLACTLERIILGVSYARRDRVGIACHSREGRNNIAFPGRSSGHFFVHGDV